VYIGIAVCLRFDFVALVEDGLLTTNRTCSTAHAKGEAECTKIGIAFLEDDPTSCVPLVEDELNLEMQGYW
jgi:hypothetical protein